ncbi:hypothetical protein B0A48_07394 [Cryoendolithus antarcticus]|uniref:Uncharacterized protein n=1 Tax=Cryoendolithus antarcticus TaxID=1507870 RepID=A0A1V8T8G4_9PEZI|nr:hypothetical protein B0A48_07394 [Cryoendolithus antarcticus]
MRNSIPPLLLQLDRDQQCYDFIKWHLVTGKPSNPFYRIALNHRRKFEGSYVLEEPYLDSRWCQYNPHLVATSLLLKLKLLVDLINVRRVRKVLGTRLLPELTLYVEEAIVRSPLSLAFCRKDDVGLQDLQHTLLRHIKLHCHTREIMSTCFLEAILGGLWYDSTVHYHDPQASPAQASLYIDVAGAAWHQTEGVLELLCAAQKSAMKDRETETEYRTGHRRFRTHPVPGSGLNWNDIERLHWEDSLVRLWDYLEFEVVDAQSISTQRPSTLHRQQLLAEWLTYERTDGGPEASWVAGREVYDGREGDVVDFSEPGILAVGDDGENVDDDADGDDATGECWRVECDC